MSDASLRLDEAGAGPAFSFGFNLGKIPDHGEDADPVLRDGPDLGLVGVFDGMGGAGGRVYETLDGPRSGAYLASRIARDVVEERMLDLLEPNWNLKGEAAAEDLRRSVQTALQEHLAGLKAPASGLRSRLLRALPTTMAVIALQRARRGGSRWACHVLWAGDSRAYALDASGLHQLSTDDLREVGDAMSNLHQDSLVSNAMSADTDFHVNYRRVELEAPFVLLTATDGCFGYLPTPMHFEQLLLATLAATRSTEDWSSALQREISAVTGDDAALAVMGVGADLSAIRSLLAPRLAAVQEEHIEPFDAIAARVAAAEQELARLRRQQIDVTAARWADYRGGYEAHLRPPAVGPDAPDALPEREDEGAPPEESPQREDASGDPAGHDPASHDPAEPETAPEEPAVEPLRTEDEEAGR
jgi:serine/threonine protein phosphatase PrpC